MHAQVQNLTVDSQRFSMRLPVALSEAGNITFAIYRNASCINGACAAIAPQPLSFVHNL